MNGMPDVAAGRQAIRSNIGLQRFSKEDNLSCFYERKFGDRVAIEHVLTGAWESAQGLGGDCVSCNEFCYYDGYCGPNEDSDAEGCPCGCGFYINRIRKISYGYAWSGHSRVSDPIDGCLVALWPPHPTNQALMVGYQILTQTGTSRYSYELTADPYGSPTGKPHGCEGGKLFYDGTLVGNIEVWMHFTRIIALMHGAMMRHAAATPANA